MTYPDARSQKAAPIGIGANAVVRNPIQKGAIITENDVTLDDSTFVYKLRRLQDAM
jgi:predicted homoserine dehydrogenase-like protein